MEHTLTIGTELRSPNYKYRIDRVLGQGSFGITYLATMKVETEVKVHGPLGDITEKGVREVHVCIKEFFMKDMNSRESTGFVNETSSSSIVGHYGVKFRREAENLSHLSHPNIVKVLEVFDANNTHYYVMEYFDGMSLDEYVSHKGGLPEQEAIDGIRVIGEALSYMHSQRMLHLDLKPKNVMRRNDGQLMLIDFGLSKQYNSSGNPETSTTVGAGTPGYAPLEQNSQRNETAFATTLDVYALGGTLFKMLTGQRPPEASEINEDGLPIDELQRKGVSTAVIELIEKAMAPRKKDRIQTVDEFLNIIGGKKPIVPCQKVEIVEDEETQIKGVEPNERKQQVIGIPITPGLAIDLGLSVKWASHNVGANSPEEYGGYYAWGETEEKSNYNKDTYEWYKKRWGIFDIYTNIGSKIIGTHYDVAHVKWGGNWRMPSDEEIQELIDNCECEEVTINGVKGFKFTSKKNGNSIFLPAAGYRDDTGVYYSGTNGNYWSGTLHPDDLSLSRAYSLYCYGSDAYWSSHFYRDNGFSVRPVSD